MNWLDVVIALLLALAVWDGWRQGVVTQALGLAAFGLGIYAAWRFGGVAGGWFGDAAWAGVAGFVVVFILVIISVMLIGRFTRGLFRVVGLGVFDSILGVIFSLLKMFVSVGLVVRIFDFFDPSGALISERVRAGSSLFQLIETVNGAIFPFIENMFKSL